MSNGLNIRISWIICDIKYNMYVLHWNVSTSASGRLENTYEIWI